MQNLFLALLVIFSINLTADEAPTYTTKELRSAYATGLNRTTISKEFIEQKKLSAGREYQLLEVIPGSYDLSARVSPPENQGSCGSCWAFSLTKALRSSLMLVGLDPGVLAFNYLIHNCAPVKEWGCNGGDFNAGQNFINTRGPWLESQDPYNSSSNGSCNKGKVAGTSIRYVAVGSGNGAPTFQELGSAIFQQHMLAIDVAVAGNWGNYSGGIYNGNGSGINHMINLVGYNCETSVDTNGHCVFNSQGQPINGNGYLIVMNNWGSEWGENGYMRTRWGRNQIADTAMYFEVDAPTPSPSPSPSPSVSPVPTPSISPTPSPVPPVPSPSSHGWLLPLLGLLTGIVLLVVGFFLGRKIK